MFGVTLYRAANMYFDNKSLYKKSTNPESVLSKNHKPFFYHSCREAVASGMARIAKENILNKLADFFTKVLPKAVR